MKSNWSSIEELEKLYEDTAKELQASTWPSIKARVAKQNIKSEYLGCDNNGRLYFKTTSGTTPGKWHRQQIEFKNLKEGIRMLNQKLTLRKKTVLKMLMDGDLSLWCSDESWHYFFKHVAWKNGYGLQREDRPNTRNNVQQDHSLCKHLCACLLLLPTIADRILFDYKKKKVLPNFITRLKNKFRGTDETEE